MKIEFQYDNVNALSNALGGRIDLLEKLVGKDGLSDEVVQIVADSEFRKDFIHLYGFHIDSNESDPSEAVTYLEDAVGMKPAFMDYAAGEFNYGDWEDAFFMPRPCMLKYDGTVDYYLDPNDYSKKADGSASDVADFEYGGNAMMEWGRDGQKIWYKIVPDKHDNTSASIYFCNYKLDDGFHAWSFINNQGDLVDHFYTSIYDGTLDTDGKLRSISGKLISERCQFKTSAEEIEAAELNNPEEDKLWYTEVYADVIIINLLLVLIGKCLNTQLVFGNGVVNLDPNNYAVTAPDIGLMDQNGLFWGTDDMFHGVKVFGMENWWGSHWRRFAGSVAVDKNILYKLTRTDADGSAASDYNATGENYINSNISFSPDNNGGPISKYEFFENGAMIIKACNGDDNKYYSDRGYIYGGYVYAIRNGNFSNKKQCGAFYIAYTLSADSAYSTIGTCLSCKPLAQSE